jgi:hypothetical protein
MAASKAGVCWKAWHLQKGHWERMSRQFTLPRSTVSMPATKTTCDGRSASLVEASTVALRQDQLARPSGASRLRLRNDRPLRAASLPQNARRHSRAQIKQIAKSIEAFGFTNPILASDEFEILAGHGRTAAALLIGMKLVPDRSSIGPQPSGEKAYVLADNKLALNGGWDRDVLAIELQGLIDLGFDIEATGFALGEIEVILDEAAEGAPNDPFDGAEDEISIVRDAAVTAAMCGGRGVTAWFCGDARDKEAYEALIGDERADLIFTDPPTTFPARATSVARAAFATGNSRWASERCPRQSSRPFWNRPSPAAERCRDGPIAFVCMDLAARG